MMSSTNLPIAEFRDANQYWQPMTGDGHEIIRPKPRRPGECRLALDVMSIKGNTSREGIYVRISPTSLKPTNREISGGSVPILKNSCEALSSSKSLNSDMIIPNNGSTMAMKSVNRNKNFNSPCTTLPNLKDVAVISTKDLHDERGIRDDFHLEKPPLPCKPNRDNPLKNIVNDIPDMCQSSRVISVHQEQGKDIKNTLLVKLESYETQTNIEKDRWNIQEESKDNVDDLCNMTLNRSSPISTDCSSLSKSSSDGDPIVLRKRPLTKLKSRRRNILNFPHHISVDELRLSGRKHDFQGGSSSDENRSSGHASMSDSHASTSPMGDSCTHILSNTVNHDHSFSHHKDYIIHQECQCNQESTILFQLPHKSDVHWLSEEERLINSTQRIIKPLNRKLLASRNRRITGSTKDDLRLPLESNSGLEDIRQAIETLTLRSQGSHTSYSTSTYSSMSGSESEPVIRRLIRHSSLETINTNVTNADEFVWIDSRSRLVELQHLPWTNTDVLHVLQNGRLKDTLERVSAEVIPRLSYLLQRPLIRIAREVQRFALPLGICSKQEINSALKIILSPVLADSCIKACLRAAAMYTVSGDQQFRQSKSSRAGLQLSIGRFHRWMCDVHLAKFIHEYSAVYLTSAIENLLEEIVLLGSVHENNSLTVSSLEHVIANNGDLWGLLQPHSHLNAGRTASGTLAMPRWPNQSSENINQCSSTVHLNVEDQGRILTRSMEQCLLTTCVGSIAELGDLLSRVVQHHHQQCNTTPTSLRQAVTWGPKAVYTLFYFMRCSQLEHADHKAAAPVQELVNERPYIVLPPLVEWVRIAVAHAEHRHSLVIDKDDVMQAARLLLPGVDCPVRQSDYDEMIWARRQMDESEYARRIKTALAFRMVSSGRTDLLPHALQLLPAAKINTLNDQGFTLLMLVCILNDEPMVQALLSNGADVDIEVPAVGSNYPNVNPETHHWTALTYSALHGNVAISKLLLEKGANVEGGARLNEDRITFTPLQLATAYGNLEMITLLLSYGAHPFLCTTTRDSLCYGIAAQKGCYSSLSVAAAHGQRMGLHKLLSHPFNDSYKEILSLEEILAEGASQLTNDRKGARYQVPTSTLEEGGKMTPTLDACEYAQNLKLSKQQIKALQEAMYHSSENGHLEITLDLRNIGIPWTLHCWMHTLKTAYDMQLESVIDQLLQDFQSVWPDDCSSQFNEECLPLLFVIFQNSKNEGTTLLLADIFSNCYGKEPINIIHENYTSNGTRIDPAFVNNPELSDVQFRVEGRIFYAHKIILVNASPRFKSMLTSKFSEESPSPIQINDVRYSIFQLVMQYLYEGGSSNLHIEQFDILELMAAANFFLLNDLLHYCEEHCAALVDQENIVAMYIHAKAYNANRLLEYCQGYLIQNMVALLTYDENVRRLIFGRKLHNHDVLAGLLSALQARIKAKHE